MTEKKNFTLIYYQIPEDFDDHDCPNVFGIPLAEENITVTNIKENFPLLGDYYFRFKFKYNNNIVWLDINSENCKIPLFNGRIVIKATRINWQKK